ncbi:RIP metalloprotease RseP [Flexibacterium corallicola]|uniref:RIP metalloprotease RseP n=1 Tax=Flexibacterium corallicola TaxID=3037259 RepID=UPI00286F19A5|nr:RIP metalloprotease RseP [Pseudovibrio sp. M1P-2-3]
MDFLSSFLGGSLGYLLPFLFVLTLVVFVHEMGHFLVARWCGVKVLAFSVGFGPELLGRNDKKGTRWKLCAIPLGGYVKFSGDENAASLPDRNALQNLSPEETSGAFHLKNVWQRAAVVAAGPFANFILAIAIFAMLLGIFGKVETLPQVDAVAPDSPAQVAGIQPGDIVLSIDGKQIDSFSDLQRIVSASADISLNLELERGAQTVDIVVTPQKKEVEDRFGNKQKIGLLGISRNMNADERIIKTYGPVEALQAGVQETWFVVSRTGSYIGDLFMGREDVDQLGGPIRVAQISGQVAEYGIVPLLNLAAVLSVSIGLLNLLPIPMLDGGHLLYYFAEMVRGKPLSERIQEYGFRVGVTLVLLLMVFATWNDLRHLFNS